ncbi:unnamed protein product [Parascedosporium putredinis]|uniref:Derlin n=1 Tax=Parascedosporium putredinis TaxID=1442378 RepID=A0A9P1H1R8_9PEZI|nr:unnamed protein product [Parascedosporium putredinis]CAI7992999.1 unnamed protein product [Parascedosporium putredinis]
MSTQSGPGEQLVDMWRRLPLFARNISTFSFVMSVLCYTNIVSIYRVLWHVDYIFKFVPEIWRLPTSFLLTRPDWGMLFDTYFLYKYLSELEKGNPRFPKLEDILWYLIYVALSIVTLNEFAWRFTPILSGPYYTFISGLIMALCYTVHQDQRGQMATFFVFPVPAQLVPYLMIASSLVMGGVDAIPLQIGGLLVAHSWDFGRRLWPEFAGGRCLLPTPFFLSYLVGTPRVLKRDYGSAYHPTGGEPSTGRTTGMAPGRGPLPAEWESRGPGRRLG